MVGEIEREAGESGGVGAHRVEMHAGELEHQRASSPVISSSTSSSSAVDVSPTASASTVVPSLGSEVAMARRRSRAA